MLKQQFGDVFTYQHIGIMKEAFDLAWPALEFAFRSNSQAAQSARECLASRILEVVAEGEMNVRLVRDEALRRYPPMTAYYARAVRNQTAAEAHFLP
jgi:hypothetical protein